MKFAVKSDAGSVRENNEDSYNIIAGYSGIPIAFIIADGMGGHNSGEVASKMAVEYISNYILRYPDTFSDDADMPSVISDIIKKANSSVFELSKEQEANYGMGTTLILAVEGNKKLFIGHVGDSRAYVIRNNEIARITVDHSYVEELVKLGSLTREEAENHPQKNIITRALGCSEDIEVDIYDYDMCENDIFVLCTDGLTNMLEEEEIKEIVLQNDNPEAACDILVRKANENGGEDNITVIVFKV
ncbi:MAG TPA: Stp1/IreP family PP2C-type Ser/Thr phosphatase [Clostridia bacterium]|nr:Stp1/IreP family PP2C-type Ser/Thr phosphatase [Clostridia bacterium]